MTELPTELRVGGFDLRQVKRVGKHAIYSQSKGGVVVAWEVIEVQELPARLIYGREYPAREGYPSNEQWGTKAWSCASLARAEERLAGLAV